jgi:hypothetical protein
MTTYDPMPSPVRAARALLWIELVLMALAGAVVLFAVSVLNRSSSDTSVGDALLLVFLWQAVIFTVTLTLTVKLSSRRRWVRIGLIALMGLNTLGYLANLAMGSVGFGTFAGLGLSAAVIVCLCKEDSRHYLDR